jgi:hypothetical protein
MIRVRTENTFPPIPYRGRDWCAWDDRCSPDDDNFTLGEGETEEQALADLLDQMGITPKRIEWFDGGAFVEARETVA